MAAATGASRLEWVSVAAKCPATDSRSAGAVLVQVGRQLVRLQLLCAHGSDSIGSNRFNRF